MKSLSHHYFSLTEIDGTKHEITFFFDPNLRGGDYAIYESRLLFLKRAPNKANRNTDFVYENDSTRIRFVWEKLGTFKGGWKLQVNDREAVFESKSETVLVDLHKLSEKPLGPENSLLSRNEIAKYYLRLGKESPYPMESIPGTGILSFALALIAGLAAGGIAFLARAILAEINRVDFGSTGIVACIAISFLTFSGTLKTLKTKFQRVRADEAVNGEL